MEGSRRVLAHVDVGDIYTLKWMFEYTSTIKTDPFTGNLPHAAATHKVAYYGYFHKSLLVGRILVYHFN